MADALAALGVEFRGISQTQMYTSGAYVEQVLLAMRERARIDAVLAEYRTGRGPRQLRSRPGRGPATPPPRKHSAEAAAEAAAEEVRRRRRGRRRDERRLLPLQAVLLGVRAGPHDVTGYDDATTELTYTCACGHHETVLLSEHRSGKLVWKVDWPMRWAYEGVIFEPSGVDHQAPGSSFVVGGRLVSEIFGGEQPIGPMYAFVGISGMAKMSSSRGGVPTPADALEIMEEPRAALAVRAPPAAAVLHRRLRPGHPAAVRRVGRGRAQDRRTALPPSLDAGSYDRAIRTAAGRAAAHAAPAAVPDPRVGRRHHHRRSPTRLLRILSELDPGTADDVAGRGPAAARLRAALGRHAAARGPADAAGRRARCRRPGGADAPSSVPRWTSCWPASMTHWSLEGLSQLVYAVPKLQAGLPADAPPTPELRAAQRAFFALVYRLLIGRDTGPRLPTLLLAAGPERIRKVLSG